MGLRLVEIEQEKARQRQRQAGDRNLKQYGKDQEEKRVSDSPPVPQNFGEPDKHQGEAMQLAARQVGVSRETLRKGQKIEAAAITDPKVAQAWDKAKKGQGSVNKVYQEVKEKEKAQKEVQGKKAAPERRSIEHLPLEEIMKWLYKVADHQGVSREDINRSGNRGTFYPFDVCGI